MPICVPGVGGRGEEGGRAGLGHAHAVADADAERAAALGEHVGQRRAAAAPVADMAERRGGEARDGRAAPGRRSARRRRCRAAAPRAARPPPRRRSPAGSSTRPPWIRVGRLWRLMPAVWKSGRKLSVVSAEPRSIARADIDVVRERHPVGVDHPLGPAGRPRGVEQIPDAVGRPVRAARDAARRPSTSAS